MSNCRNCEKSIVTDIKFCPHCGQKNTDGKIRVWSFFAVFFNEAFNIESKLFKTMRDLFIPGKLTIEYFKGKHKTYFHPLRFFMVLAILLLAFLNFFGFGVDLTIDLSNENFEEINNNSALFYQLDSLNDANYETKQYDNPTYRHIRQLVCNTLGEYEEIMEHSDTILLFGENEQYAIEDIDIVRLDGQEFVDKYKLEGFWKILAIQSFKALRGGIPGFIDFIYSNIIWAALLMMPFLALILKLFYFKEKQYYVEHLVFCFHIHSFIFLLITLGLLVVHFLNIDSILILLFLIVPLYIIFAIKKVYDQRWSTTLFKFAGISSCYAILSSIFMALTLVLGFMFF